MNAIAIRNARRDDCPAIATMIAALAAETGVMPPRAVSTSDLERDGFGPDPAFGAIIAELTVPIGCCLFCRSYSTFRGRAGLYIVDLYVAAAARGQNVGRRLLAAAARSCPEGETAFVKLELKRDNAKAFGLYQSLGFRPLDGDRLVIIEGQSLDALRRM